MELFLVDQVSGRFLQSDKAKVIKSGNMVCFVKKLNKNSQNHSTKTKTEPSEFLK